MEKNIAPNQTESAISAGWRTLLRAFDTAHTTLQKADFFDSRTSLKLGSAHIVEIIDWAQDADYIEPADKQGHLRLTQKGRESWTDARDPGSALREANGEVA
jgi:hypothetical protein